MGVADAIDTPPKYSGSAFWGAQDDVQLPLLFPCLKALFEKGRVEMIGNEHLCGLIFKQ